MTHVKPLIFLYGLLVLIAALLVYREYDQPGFVAGASTEAELYRIPELAVAFIAPHTIQLIHEVKPQSTELGSTTVAYFSSEEIQTLLRKPGTASPACDLSNGPLGTLTALPGYPNLKAASVPPHAKRIGTTYIFYTPPAPCTENAEITKAITKQQAFVQEILSSLQSLDGKMALDATSGTIEGLLTIPKSTTIPKDVHVCAVNTSSMENFCTFEPLAQEPETPNQYRYALSVPTGNYHVYSTTAANPYDPNAFRAYYSAYITCGQTENCRDHTPIAVPVEHNHIATKVNPSDWTYYGDDTVIALLMEGYKKETSLYASARHNRTTDAEDAVEKAKREAAAATAAEQAKSTSSGDN